MKVSDTGLDAFEIGLLAVLRHFCTSFCAPHSQAWMTAYGIATERWGISDGPKAAQSLLAVAEAMRRSRPTTFVFPARPVWSAANASPRMNGSSCRWSMRRGAGTMAWRERRR
ncbi:MAG: hypothetical protein HC774_08325 [Sphingomonadales bacterium]|nr:hypothetical protein [Sphingomonadales bacterium]